MRTLIISAPILLAVATDKLAAQTLHHFRFETDPGLSSDSVGNAVLEATGSVVQVALPNDGRGAHFPTNLAGIGPNQSASESLGTVSGFLAEETTTVDDAFTIELFAHLDSLDASVNRSVLAAQSAFPRVGGPSTFGWAFVAERVGNNNGSASSQPRELELFASDGADTQMMPSRIFLEENTDYFLSASFDVNSDVRFYVENLSTKTAQFATVPHALATLHPNPVFGVMWPENWSHVNGIVDEVRFSRGVLAIDDLLTQSMPDNAVLLPRAAYEADPEGTRDNREANLAVVDPDENLFLKFDVPDLGASAADRLRNATLRVYVDRISDNPESAVISLSHSATDNDFEMLVSDLTDPSYTDTNVDLFQPGDTPDRYFEVDVTDWVRTDYLQEGREPVASFRLEPTERSRISMARSATKQPQLVLSFVPEPNAASLLIIGMTLVLSRNRRKQRG